MLAEKAKQKKEASRNDFGIFEKPVSSIEQNGIAEDKIDSLGFIAKDAKVGRATVAKVNKILEKAPEKIQQECPCKSQKELAEKLQISYDSVCQWIMKSTRLSEKVKRLQTGSATSFSDFHAKILLKYPHIAQDKLAQTAIDKSLVS